jgi:hypothetical protein
VDQASAHVPKDLAVPHSDYVEQDQAIVAADASQDTAPVTADVDQSVAHVPKDFAVPKPDSAERETAIVAMDAS